MSYIRPEGITKKLRLAKKNEAILYITGTVGAGKTAAVRYAYRRKRHVYAVPRDGVLAIQTPESWQNVSPDKAFSPDVLLDNGIDTVIIDDVQRLRDHFSVEAIIRLIPVREIQLIIIGRGALPAWLAAREGERPIMLADDEDLLLTPQTLRGFIEDRDVTMDDENEQRVLTLTRGLPIYVDFVLMHTSDGILTDERETAATDSFYKYLDAHFFEEIDAIHAENLVNLAHFETFDVDFARVVTANYLINVMLENMLTEGNYVMKTGQTEYSIREPYRGYLIRRYSLNTNARYDSELFGRAAVYYELEKRMPEALECLSRCGSQERLYECIMNIVRAEPMLQTSLKYIDKYMIKLTAETIYSTPVLMAARSMSCSLRLHPPLAEEWYSFLSEYSRRTDIRENDRKEAEYRLAFLDLMLPHRGLHDIEKRLTRVIEAQNAWNGIPGRVSFTWINPSFINGSFDLTTFHGSGIDREDNRLLMQMASFLLNIQFEGFRNLLREEFLFESGEFNEYKIGERVNAIYMLAERNGDEETCFAAVGVLTRLSAYTGRYDMILQMITNYKAKLQRRGAAHLIPSVEILEVMIGLIRGNTERANAWFENAPDSTVTFALPLMNTYLLKLRIYLVREMYDQAGILIGRLENIMITYGRTYMLVETRILKAIMLFRSQEEEWAGVLTETLQEAFRYGIMQLMAQEGAALLPLLKKLPPENTALLDPDRFEKLLTLTTKMAERNPNYLRTRDSLEEPLTEAEANVLKMLCRQMTSDEMCKELHITYSGLKYHKGNIYRKLGVKGRVEAQRKAEKLNLL